MKKKGHLPTKALGPWVLLCMHYVFDGFFFFYGRTDEYV